MITLPPGCTVGYEIKIIVDVLTPEMGEWFEIQGGHAWTVDEYDWRGRKVEVLQVKLGNAKQSYKLQDGTGNYLLRFNGLDAPTASVFVLKFNDNIIKHNMQETLDRYERDHA